LIHFLRKKRAAIVRADATHTCVRPERNGCLFRIVLEKLFGCFRLSTNLFNVLARKENIHCPVREHNLIIVAVLTV